MAQQYRPEHLALAVGAIVVIAVFATENIVRGYLLHLANVVEWWQYATPVFAALVVVDGYDKTVMLIMIAIGALAGAIGSGIAASRFLDI